MMSGTGSLHGRVDGRCAAAYGPCTRPCNVSCARYMAAVYTAREHAFARENGRITAVPYTRPVHGRVWAVHTSTPPVYMIVYGPSVRTSSAVYMARTQRRTRDVYTALYWPCTRPCTLHVYGRVHVSTCIRAVTRPCTGHLHGRKRPYTRPCNVSCIRPCTGRIGSCTQQCTHRVHGRFRPCTPAVYTAVFGHLHSEYTAV